MKPLMTAILLSLVAMPVMAQSMNVGDMMPTLTLPSETPDTGTETVAQDVNDINK